MSSTNTSTCTSTSRNGTSCKRNVRTGQIVCWQHARGLKARWKSLSSRQRLGFALTVVGIILTVAFGLSPIWIPSKPQAMTNIMGNNGTIVMGNGNQTTGNNIAINPSAKDDEALRIQLQDISQDIEARQVQTTEQVRVLRECISNPRSGKCSESVGARLQRSRVEKLNFGDSVSVVVKRTGE
jgi:hypothetical protein